MVNTTIGPPVTRLAEVNKLLLNQQNERCLDYKYDKMIAEIKNISWDASSANGNRQWTFQTCNEFGFYQTSDDDSLVFGSKFPLDFFVKQCIDIYGIDFNDIHLNRSIVHTNIFYGGLNEPTTNVIYVHGSIDPWHALGLIESPNPLMPTIYIQGTAHCANMYEPHVDDLPQLKEARKTINQFIRNVLNN